MPFFVFSGAATWRLAGSALCIVGPVAALIACAGSPDSAPARQRGQTVTKDGRVVPAPAFLRPVAKSAAVNDEASCRAHEPDGAELGKQVRRLDPLNAPALYDDLFYGRRPDPAVALVVQGVAYEPYKRFDDPDSGLSGSVLLDTTQAHALILFKGMDRLFIDNGGFGGVLTDLGAILQAKFGTANAQFVRAEEAYTEALCDPRIQTIELIGYSLGSQFGNYLAAKYGAVGSVFGDMGLDRTLLKQLARGDVPGTRQRIKANITSLTLSGDVVVKLFGVGDVVGDVVYLPGGVAGVFHQPEVYAYAAKAALHDRDMADPLNNLPPTGAGPGSKAAAPETVAPEAREASGSHAAQSGDARSSAATSGQHGSGAATR